MFAPERVDRLAVLSVGHPATFLRDATSSARSPGTCSCSSSRASPSSGSETTTGRTCARGASHPDVDAVIAELEASASLTPGLSYYRANIPASAWVAPRAGLPRVTTPTMGIWSTGDFALTEVQMTDSADSVDDFRYERVEGAGHWLQLDAPDRVNALLVDFLSR